MNIRKILPILIFTILMVNIVLADVSVDNFKLFEQEDKIPSSTQEVSVRIPYSFTLTNHGDKVKDVYYSLLISGLEMNKEYYGSGQTIGFLYPGESKKIETGEIFERKYASTPGSTENPSVMTTGVGFIEIYKYGTHDVNLIIKEWGNDDELDDDTIEVIVERPIICGDGTCHDIEAKFNRCPEDCGGEIEPEVLPEEEVEPEPEVIDEPEVLPEPEEEVREVIIIEKKSFFSKLWESFMNLFK